ncbi:glycoside hydrolase family 31 protein [Microbacter margulisiae]|uniref:Alpha-glucosidase n=1 Tax=Microbacter margulisiae TaxID=1350067 RepID=A0A7W5H2J1_9PORP|nr:glycoside hydrolase family 31 protein [Microbacter margulisiae]MBB3188748.1 alpha-glucosidase [Microbacter margulisiae]
MKRYYLLWILLGILYPNMKGQVPANSPLGNVKKIEVSHSTYTFLTTNGRAQVTVYSPGVIRIRVAHQAFAPDFSYAVEVKPEACHVQVTDAKGLYTISTDSVTLRITKDPLRFTFLTKTGEVINADDPAFGTSWLGEEVTTYKTLQPGERFIGMGEHGGNLDRAGTACVNYNTDNPEYDDASDRMYSTIPFYMGLHDHLAYGIFMDNSSRSLFSFGAGSNRFDYFRASCGEMNYYFIYHSTVKGIIGSYTWLTGRTPIPPIWSLGYQQCRWCYFPEADLLSTAAKFRERHIPIDMIYLDINYMDHYKIFTWDPNRFPDPKAMTGKLQKMGMHLAVIIDPGVKIAKNYPVYQQGVDSSLFIKYPDGTNYAGQVWPGWCNFPDFTMPKTRAWWGRWVKTYADEGVTGFWNDMNEIAVWGKEVPDLLNLNWDGLHTTYRQAKNVYGFQMARSTYEGAKKYMDGKRPFVLSRSGYSGLQRYTAIWTGDNQAKEDHMLLGVRLINSLGLSGVTFAGMDVGGFSGNPTQSLYTRWMEIGAFLPMYRAHTTINSNREEPWDFGETCEDIARRYIGFRYQLLPYIYAGFYESSQDGMPLNRSLAINYTNDSTIYDPEFQQEYLFGPSILVAPVKGTESLCRVYLPEGNWYDLFNDKPYAGKQVIVANSELNRLPLYVKAGSIIPMQKLVESTADNSGDTLFINLYEGQQPNQYRYYEDDGTTYKYESGHYYKRLISYDPQQAMLTFGKKEGSFTSRFHVITLVLHGFTPEEVQHLTVNGAAKTVTPEEIRFFTSHFAFADYGPFDTKHVLSVSFPDNDNEMQVHW